MDKRVRAPRQVGDSYIRYLISPRGDVEVEVFGVTGSGCRQVTAPVLTALGGRQQSRDKDGQGHGVQIQ